MRGRNARFALGILAAASLAAACSAALDHPTPQDAQWASNEWPGTTVEDLAHGRALYVDKCSGCHNLHLPAEHTPEEWKAFVAYMVADAKITPEEQAAIVRYLSAASARNHGLETLSGSSPAGSR